MSSTADWWYNERLPELQEEERKQKNAKTLLEGVEEFKSKAKQVLLEKTNKKVKKVKKSTKKG
ncbi:MAG: hypothetical protein CXT73_02385 [Methanobacteriota archaeon]|jgi:hypothetical protein|nr:MAG: hypothetical protein CXT73_02385 [Euryarchaeota archaeon]